MNFSSLETQAPDISSFNLLPAMPGSDKKQKIEESILSFSKDFPEIELDFTPLFQKRLVQKRFANLHISAALEMLKVELYLQEKNALLSFHPGLKIIFDIDLAGNEVLCFNHGVLVIPLFKAKENAPYVRAFLKHEKERNNTQLLREGESYCEAEIHTFGIKDLSEDQQKRIVWEVTTTFSLFKADKEKNRYLQDTPLIIILNPQTQNFFLSSNTLSVNVNSCESIRSQLISQIDYFICMQRLQGLQDTTGIFFSLHESKSFSSYPFIPLAHITQAVLNLDLEVRRKITRYNIPFVIGTVNQINEDGIPSIELNMYASVREIINFLERNIAAYILRFKKNKITTQREAVREKIAQVFVA